MNSKKIMEIKRIYKQQEGAKKLEDIYYKSFDIVSNRFDPMIAMIEELLELSNIALSMGTDMDVQLKSDIYNKHKQFNMYFSKVMEEMKMIRNAKYDDIEQYITEYKVMYFKIILRVLGKSAGKSERKGYTTFLISSEVVRYRRAISEYIRECVDELSLYYSEVSSIVSAISDMDTVNELVNEEDIYVEQDNVQDNISYIANVRDLEKMAKALGYVLKSQNGSHRKYENIETHQCVTIPFHRGKDIGVGLSRSIQKQLIEGVVA